MDYKTDPLIKEINKVSLIDHITASAFALGVIAGIILASFLHKYIVHPFGW